MAGWTWIALKIGDREEEHVIRDSWYSLYLKFSSAFRPWLLPFGSGNVVTLLTLLITEMRGR